MSETLRILTAVDFSESAERALGLGADLAARLGGSLVLVHIHEVADELDEASLRRGAGISLYEEDLFDRRRELAALAAEIVPAAVRYELRVQVANQAALGLLHVIAEERPYLVVVGSRGRSGLLRLVLGSVSAELCRKSPVPVVVVSTDSPSTVDAAESEAAVLDHKAHSDPYRDPAEL